MVLQTIENVEVVSEEEELEKQKRERKNEFQTVATERLQRSSLASDLHALFNEVIDVSEAKESGGEMRHATPVSLASPALILR